MKKYLSLFAAVLITLAPISLSLAAEAKAPVVMVIDVNRIMSESLAAKNVRDQVNGLRKQLKDDVEGKEKALRSAQEDLMRQKSTMKPEDLSAKQKAFEERVMTSRKEVDGRVAGLDRAVARAQGTVEKELQKILFDMAKEQNANLVLPKAAILVAETSMDFTEEAMARLNKTLPSVKVDMNALASAPAASTPAAAASKK